MKALILVGGYGTRLRPLTFEQPKPLLQFCNKSILDRQAGVNEIILAIGHKPRAMQGALDVLAAKYGIQFRCSIETSPLGTAGPLKLAESLILDGSDKNTPFFVLNSDIICGFPLCDMLKSHMLRGSDAEATILVKQVEDPSMFGAVICESMKVKSFIEKPKNYGPTLINAGVYLLCPKILEIIDSGPSSIEREVFPKLASKGTLFAYELESYWADIGRPSDYLKGLQLHLAFLNTSKSSDEQLSKESYIEGNVLVDPNISSIGKDCLIGPNVTIASGCTIGNGVRISNAALMKNVTVKDHSFIDGALIGWDTTLEEWTHVEGLTVIAEDVCIKTGCCLNQSQVLPHLTVSESLHTPGFIKM